MLTIVGPAEAGPPVPRLAPGPQVSQLLEHEGAHDSLPMPHLEVRVEAILRLNFPITIGADSCGWRAASLALTPLF